MEATVAETPAKMVPNRRSKTKAGGPSSRSAKDRWRRLTRSQIKFAPPEPVDDAVDSLRQVVPVGVEREVEQLGCRLLRLRRLDVGVPKGAVELRILRMCRQCPDGATQHYLEVGHRRDPLGRADNPS